MLNFCFRLLSLVCLLTSFALPAFALTEAQVVERLAAIPIFVITDRDGIPLVGSNNGEQDRVLPFFLNPQDAEAAVATIAKQEDKSADLDAQVVVRSMQDMYNFIQNNQDNGLVYQIVPSESSLAAASELTKAKDDRLPNVPVFFAVEQGGENNNGLFTVSQGERVFIPFFFEKAELDRLIAEVNKNDKLKTKPEIKVISFFQVLNSMIDTEEGKPSPEVEKFAFFPAQASFDWIQVNLKADGKESPASGDSAPSPKS